MAHDSPMVLLIEDEPVLAEITGFRLELLGFQVETASSATGMIAAVRRTDFDTVLMDMNYVRGTTSGTEGLDLLSEIQKTYDPPTSK